MESVKLTQYPKEDEKYLYFYFSKNDSDDYIDLQQRVCDCAIITPIPNLYPYDTTINVQYKISKDSDESEWFQYILPYKKNASPEIMGFPLTVIIGRLTNNVSLYYKESTNPTIMLALDKTICELLKYTEQTKKGLLELIFNHYGDSIVNQKFSYTPQQQEKYKSVWNRPKMPHRAQTFEFNNWFNILWKSEVRLFDMVKAFLPDAVMHYTASWLGNQHLDIFSANKQIAFEYQGKQHYEPVAFFNKETSFEEKVLADERKRKLCKENGVKLIEWSYTTPIYPIFLIEELKKHTLESFETPSLYRKKLWEDLSWINQTVGEKKKSHNKR